MRVYRTSNDKIELTSWGSRQQLCVLLHASSTGPQAFKELAGYLDTGARRLVAPAFVGYGSEQPFSFGIIDHTAANRAIANAALESTNGRYRVVFGHSMGGLIALLTAIDQARLGRPIDALILYEPILHTLLDPGSPEDAEALAWDREIITALARDVEDGKPESGVSRFVEAWNESAWLDIPAGARRHLVDNADNLVRETKSMSTVAIERSVIEMFDTPVLVMHGDRSPKFVQLVAERAVAHMPRSEKALLRGCGHMAPLNAAGRVAEGINKFLENLELK